MSCTFSVLLRIPAPKLEPINSAWEKLAGVKGKRNVLPRMASMPQGCCGAAPGPVGGLGVAAPAGTWAESAPRGSVTPMGIDEP